MAVALIVAAGRGERLGGKVPKAFVELAGRPLLRWSIDALAAVEGVARALDVPGGVRARATDDAWLVERAGGRVIVVDIGPENIKVTTPLDLRIAELALAERAATRAGDAVGA